MSPIIEVQDLSKTYAIGTVALSGVTLDIAEGEILALLGPNGAGKTTFISILCGLVTPSGGRALVGGHDIVRDYRAARALIGLVPQEIAVEPFERVMNTLRFSRGLVTLFGNVAFTRAVAYHEDPDDPIAHSVGTFMLSTKAGGK